MTVVRDQTINNMKEEVYQKAITKSRCIDACKSANGGPKELALKSIELLLELDREFKNKLHNLLLETEKRLQKEFDEL